MDDVRDPSIKGGESNPVSLSVVIPAYNEARRLGRTLEVTADFLDSRGDRYEIIVVDDGSRDATASVAREWSQGRTLQAGCCRVLNYAVNSGKGYAVRYGVL